MLPSWRPKDDENELKRQLCGRRGCSGAIVALSAQRDNKVVLDAGDLTLRRLAVLTEACVCWTRVRSGNAWRD